uniref:Uncharacterized protein n=1 Tax=Phalansterium sp. PJK-2012 TaxID=1267188 RepID=T1QE05_9EUKA|nr:hypothetical protein [Phalansterium sp. PJK-2012]
MNNIYFIFLCFFSVVHIISNFYFHDMPRHSLENYLELIVDDTNADEPSAWEHKFTFPTAEDWSKLELKENKFIVNKIKIYSNVENKFVDFNLYILIQQGGNNSLLKRGVYFNIAPTDPKPSFFIRSTQLQSVNKDHPKYNDTRKGGIVLFDPHGFLKLPAAVTLKIENSVINGVTSAEEKEVISGSVFADIVMREDLLIKLDSDPLKFNFEKVESNLKYFVSSTFIIIENMAKEIYAFLLSDPKNVYDPYKIEKL